jgi:uncharacterized membrane protein
MVLSRRKLLVGLTGLIAAPAIVRAASLMPSAGDWDEHHAAKSGAVVLGLFFGFFVFAACFWWFTERD